MTTPHHDHELTLPPGGFVFCNLDAAAIFERVTEGDDGR